MTTIRNAWPVCLFALCSACDIGAPDPRPIGFAFPEISTSLGPYTYTTANALVGDTVIIRMRVLDAHRNNPIQAVIIDAVTSEGTGSVTPRQNISDANGWAEFSLRIDTTIDSETNNGTTRVDFFAGDIMQQVTVIALPAAPTVISIPADSIVVERVHPFLGILPVIAIDQYGNPTGPYQGVWTSRDSSLTLPRAANGSNIYVQAIRPGTTWIVGSSCTGRLWRCATANSVTPADSVRVIVK